MIYLHSSQIYTYIILRDGCERSPRFRFLFGFYGGTPDTFAFPPSCLRFPQPLSRVALAGLRRVLSRERVSESRATDERGLPQVEGYSLGAGDTEILFSSVVEICFDVVLNVSRVTRVGSSGVVRI